MNNFDEDQVIVDSISKITNRVLHNNKGPAVVFNDNKEIYVINGSVVSKDKVINRITNLPICLVNTIHDIVIDGNVGLASAVNELEAIEMLDFLYNICSNFGLVYFRESKTRSLKHLIKSKNKELNIADICKKYNGGFENGCGWFYLQKPDLNIDWNK